MLFRSPNKKGPRAAAPIETAENVGRPTRGTTTYPTATVGRREQKKGKMVSVAPLKKAGRSGTPAAAPSTSPPKRSAPRKELEAGE